MKTRFLLGLLLTAALGALPGAAQVMTVTYLGPSSGDTLPGSPTDYIFPDTSNYPTGTFVSEDNGNAYSELSSFYLAGYVSGQKTSSSDAEIVTPAGGSPILTASIATSGGTLGFGIEPGTGEDFLSDNDLNPNFNYNDFYVYLMYSNVGGSMQDDTISLEARTDDSSIVSTAFVTLGTNSPADTNTSTDTADYLEFEVKGLGTAIMDGDEPDLVVSATSLDTSSGHFTTYIGAVSFESAPEPRTWAMLLGGIGILLGAQRLRRTTRL